MISLLQSLYAWVVRRRNAQFDSGKRPVVQVTKPVISVGNITAGGTGKSPAVQLVARILMDNGLRPAIVLRGYKRRSKGLVVVHDGTSICATVERAGDEAFMHATMLNVPVVVSSDKVEAAAHAAGCLPCDVIIVDDGYQHRSLHRCIDVVLVNDETLTSTLLPGGRLREPINELRRASIIICAEASLENRIQDYSASNALVVSSTIEMHCDAPLDSPVIIASGIAHPDRMRISLEHAGYMIVKHMVYDDHHRYRTRDIWNIRDAAASMSAVVVTTDKDIAKIRSVDSSNDLHATSIRVAHIRMRINQPEFTERLLQDIRNEHRRLEE
jgi:tetraacyldisaccharide 4'-kinase